MYSWHGSVQKDCSWSNSLLILPFKLFYLFCFGFFFFFLGKMMRVLTWRSMLCIYLFIYLVPFLLQASTAAAIVFFSLLSSSDLGTFRGGLQCLLCWFVGWRDSGGTAAAAPWLLRGPPRRLTQVGVGSGGDGGGVLLTCVYRIDIWKAVLDGVPSGSSLGLCSEQHVACWFYLSEILYRGIKEILFFFFYTWRFLNKILFVLTCGLSVIHAEAC